VVTAVKRQISKKSGAEYARLTLEDFTGTAEALVFPEAWAKLNSGVHADGAYLLTGGYIPRDRGEEQAPFIVDTARSLDELKPSGAIGLALRWTASRRPDPETARAIAALCAAHPGPAPVFIEWTGANGGGAGDETVRLRSRQFKVDADEELIAALRGIVGADGVVLVRA
jgi:DNA polymerase-3 subunit alpha